MKITSLIFCSLIFLLSNCKPKEYTFDALPETQLQFGSGGGISGATTTFTLLKNGQLFKTTSLDKKTIALESFNSKEAEEFYSRAKDILTTIDEINKPGNRYYFLNWVEEGESKRIIWGKTDFEVPKNVNQLHNELLAKTK